MNTVKQATAKAKELMVGHRYLYGGKGQKYTKALVNKLAKAYPSTYTASLKAEALKDADKGYIAGDCSWFVCTVLGIEQIGSSAIKGKAVSLLKIDKTKAKEGMAIWRDGHIAYIGDNLKIYEARSTAKDFTVSSWDSRAKDFTYMFVVKGSGLEAELKAQPTRKFLYGGIDYSPVFDPDYYANHNADVKAVYGTDATKLFNHFTVYGMREGRQANEKFNVNVYRARYLDLQSAYGSNLKMYYQHYIVYGIKEGRQAV